jgi:endonuclease/exonuclease/phosphatase (EEP) superfamily protein YafD
MMQRTRLLHANVFLPTWPAAPLALPQVALDHVLVSPGLTFAAATLARKLGSDHLPLMVEIVVRAKTGATAPTPGLDGERP